ncbi:MAG: hypothetical protein ACKOD8_04010 [Limnohabitans sp.]
MKPETSLPEVTQARIDRLNMLPAEAAHVIDTFKSIQNYLELKRLI